MSRHSNNVHTISKLVSNQSVSFYFILFFLTGLLQSQLHYVEKILKKFEHFGMSPMYRPYDANVHLVKNYGDSVSQVNLHKSLVV